MADKRIPRVTEITRMPAGWIQVQVDWDADGTIYPTDEEWASGEGEARILEAVRAAGFAIEVVWTSSVEAYGAESGEAGELRGRADLFHLDWRRDPARSAHVEVNAHDALSFERMTLVPVDELSPIDRALVQDAQERERQEAEERGITGNDRFRDRDDA
jgi:hypothetical protein